MIPPEVFKLIDEGDDDWRPRFTVDEAATKKALHEWVTIIQLAKNGHHVHVRAESKAERIPNPDVLLDTILTELKAPAGEGVWAIYDEIRKGRRQSKNVVIDLQRYPLSIEEACRQSEQAFRRYADLESIMVLKESEEVWFKR